MSSLEKNSEYNSSRPRLYLNGAVVTFAVILTVASLAAAFDLTLLLLYVGLSTALTLLMCMIKLFLASKTQEQLSGEKQTADKSHTINWSSILILSIAVMIALILPIILVAVLDPASWFICFTSIATGMGLSEIVLYRFTMDRRSVKGISRT